MKCKIERRLPLALSGAIFAAALCPPVTAQEFSEVTLRHASGLPQTYPMVVTTNRFNDLVEQETGGKVKVQMFWGGSLG